MANYDSPRGPNYKMTQEEAEELRRWEEKSNAEIAKKRERRLGHIKGHLTNILGTEFPEDSQDFEIGYEQMTEYGGTGKSMYSQGGNVSLEHSPAFRFVLTRKDNPGEKYPILHLLKQDVDRNVKVADILSHYQLIRLGNKHIKSGIEKLKGEKHTGLEDRSGITPGVVSITLVIASLFLLSSNITGNTIANITKTHSNMIGIGFFVIGIFAGIYYFMKK